MRYLYPILAVLLATNAWAQPGTFPGSGSGATTLDGLTDVTLTSPAEGGMLLYDADTSQWIDNVMSGDCALLDTGAIDCTSIDWTALTGYPSACSAGSFVSTLADAPTCGAVVSFTTITTSAGTSPVADALTDMLTLTGTAPIVVTGTEGTDTIVLTLTQNAGTYVTADLEEETHATEHSLGGTDPVTVTNLASACTDAQVLGGTAGGTGVECQTAAAAEVNDLEAQDPANIQANEFYIGTAAGAGQFIALSDDATVAGATGVVTVADVTCTDCLNATEIEDLYLLIAGDTSAGNYTLTGDWDFGGGGVEVENGTTPPACTAGQLYVDTDATAGQQLMACEAGTFVKQGDGGGAETNDLEATDPPTIADKEIYVGNGAGSGTFVLVSSNATLANTGALDVTSADCLDSDEDLTCEVSWTSPIVQFDTNDDGTIDTTVHYTGLVNTFNMWSDGEADQALSIQADVTTSGASDDSDVTIYGRDGGTNVGFISWVGSGATADARLTFPAGSVNSTEIRDSTILAADMADADHGQVSWTTNVATVEDMTCTNCIGSTEIDGSTLESELEAVADLQDFQGAVTDAQVPAALTLAGSTIATSALTLVQSAAPAPTAEGVIEWETDDDHIITGDGAAQVEFVPAEDVSGDATMTDAGVVTVTGIDISADTNLGVTAPVVRTDDTISLDIDSATDFTTANDIDPAVDYLLVSDSGTEKKVLAGQMGIKVQQQNAGTAYCNTLDFTSSFVSLTNADDGAGNMECEIAASSDLLNTSSILTQANMPAIAATDNETLCWGADSDVCLKYDEATDNQGEFTGADIAFQGGIRIETGTAAAPVLSGSMYLDTDGGAAGVKMATVGNGTEAHPIRACSQQSIEFANRTGTSYGMDSGVSSTLLQAVGAMVAADSTFLNMYCRTYEDGGAADTFVFTLQSNDPTGTDCDSATDQGVNTCSWVDSTVTCTITGDGSAPHDEDNCADTTHSVSVNAGDMIRIKSVNTGWATGFSVCSWIQCIDAL